MAETPSSAGTPIPDDARQADGGASPARHTRWIVEWSLGAAAFGGASLLVPLYMVELGASPLMLGVLASTAAMVGVPSALLVGRLADKTPRLVVLVESALFLVLAALLALPFVDHLIAIVLLNAVIWAAFAGAGPVLNLLAVAGADENQWQNRIARLNSFQGWGWAGGLVLGAVALSVLEPRLGSLAAQRTYFGLCAGFVALAALGLAFDAPRQSTLRHLDPRKLRRAILAAPRMAIRGATFPFAPGRVYDWAFRKLRPRQFVERFTLELSVYYLAVLCFFAGFSVFFAPLPIYLGETGFSSGSIFTLYLVSSLGAAVSFGTAGRLAERHNLGTLQVWALVGRGLAMPAVVAAGAIAGAAFLGLVLAGVLFAVIGMAWAVIAVTAATLVVRLAPEGNRGEALGFYAATSALAGALGGILGGWLAGLGYVLAFATAGGLILLGATLVMGLRKAFVSEGSKAAGIAS